MDLGMWPLFKEQRQFFLALAYAKKTTESETLSILSIIEFNSAVFLASKKFNENFTYTPFVFQATKYGPEVCDYELFLNELEQENLLEWDTEEKPSISFTEKGLEQAEEAYTTYSEDQQRLFRWVWTRHISRDNGAMLSFLYHQYSSFFDKNPTIES